MKKFFNLFLCVSIALVFTACNSKKSRFEQVQEFQSTLNSEDTTQMLKISNDCMELLKAKKVGEALSMLYTYNEEEKSVQPISEAARKKYEHQFKIFPVLEYDLQYYSFQLEGVNDVKYSIKFAESDPEVGGDFKTAFMLNPVKVDGNWYLTVKSGEDFDHLKN